MRSFLIIFSILTFQTSFGQVYIAVTDSLNHFKDFVCDTEEEKNAIELIVTNRKKNYLSQKLDTTKATRIKIEEWFHFKRKEYKIIEDYYFDTISRRSYYNKDLYFSSDTRSWWEEKYFDTAKNLIKYFNPFPITYIIGCGQASHPKNESKIIARLKSKAENSEPVKESFYLLTTVIDKQMNKITFALFIPKIGKRTFCSDVWCIIETNSLHW